MKSEFQPGTVHLSRQYIGISSNKFWSSTKISYCGDYLTLFTLGKGYRTSKPKSGAATIRAITSVIPHDTHFGYMLFTKTSCDWCGVFRSSDVTRIGTISIRHGPLMLGHQTFQKFSHKQPTGVHTHKESIASNFYIGFLTL